MEYKGIESAPYVNGSPYPRSTSEVRPYGPTRDHDHHVFRYATWQHPNGWWVPRVIMSLIVKTLDS